MLLYFFELQEINCQDIQKQESLLVKGNNLSSFKNFFSEMEFHLNFTSSFFYKIVFQVFFFYKQFVFVIFVKRNLIKKAAC